MEILQTRCKGGKKVILCRPSVNVLTVQMKMNRSTLPNNDKNTVAHTALV
jgi:hypothetical protein